VYQRKRLVNASQIFYGLLLGPSYDVLLATYEPAYWRFHVSICLLEFITPQILRYKYLLVVRGACSDAFSDLMRANSACARILPNGTSATYARRPATSSALSGTTILYENIKGVPARYPTFWMPATRMLLLDTITLDNSMHPHSGRSRLTYCNLPPETCTVSHAVACYLFWHHKMDVA
jgi:hypothetical protein